MDVTPLVRKDHKIIQSYADGRFRVSGEMHEGAIIVMPVSVNAWETVADSVSDLALSDFDQLLEQADEIDVVLLGCGPSMAFMDGTLKKTLSEQGLPVDVMDSGAACRTYNVLMAEGRRVVAALFPV